MKYKNHESVLADFIINLPGRNLKDVDLEEVKRWSDVEGKLDEFEKIAENLRGNE